MKFAELDTHESGNKPLTNCVRWLRSCLASCTHWNSSQHEAAQQAVNEAETLMAQELSPNITQAQLQALTTRLEAEESPLKVLQERHVVGAWLQVTPDELSRIVLYESTLRDKVVAMDAALSEVTVRIAFMGWPAESFWRDGSGAIPRWVPDWRREIGMISAARHGKLPAKTQREGALPWNRIPEEERPGHLNQHAKLVHRLHLAWLRYRERDDHYIESDKSPTSLSALLALKDEMQAAFEKKPASTRHVPDLSEDPQVVR